MSATETVLVGVDGSPASRLALTWAARRVSGTSAHLRLVHVSTPLGVAPGAPAPAMMPSAVLTPGALDVATQDRAERALLDSAVDVVRQVDDRVEVSTERLIGAAGPVLVEASGGASLVVLGSRELGAVAGLVLGSVSRYVCGHSVCPTVVVHGSPDRKGPVVVGVDGLEPSAAAAAFAIQEARRTGAGLVAVHSIARPMPTGAGEAAVAAGLGADLGELAGRQLVDEILAPLQERYPEVPVDVQVTEATATDALLDRAPDACLVVVGSSGHGGLAGLILGSTSQAVLRQATCPVAVVRGTPQMSGAGAG